MEYAKLFQNISVGDVILWSLAIGFIGHKLGAILENYYNKKKKIETKDNTLQTHTDRIESIETKFDKMCDKIDALQESVDKLSELSDQREARRLRGEILKFSEGLRRGKTPTKDAFRNIFDYNEEYENLIEKRDIKNGYTEREMEFVKQMYGAQYGVQNVKKDNA